MGRHRIDELTERQKQCLRLIYENLSVKEIGLALDLSPHTVNEYLREARRTLGAARSMQAARHLVAAEGDNRTVPDANGVDARIALLESKRADQRGTARNRYNLPILMRIGIIMMIAAAAVPLIGAFMMSAEVISRIFLEHEIDISDPPYRK